MKEDYFYETYDKKLVLNTIKWPSSYIWSITDFSGGIISQEINNSTWQYIPFNQWLGIFRNSRNIKDVADKTQKN